MNELQDQFYLLSDFVKREALRYYDLKDSESAEKVLSELADASKTVPKGIQSPVGSILAIASCLRDTTTFPQVKAKAEEFIDLAKAQIEQVDEEVLKQLAEVDW